MIRGAFEVLAAQGELVLPGRSGEDRDKLGLADAQEGDRVIRLRLELDRIGRRRGTAAEVADGARALLDQLTLWLAEIEQGVAGLTRDTLAPEGGSLLARMETARPATA